MHFCNSEIRGAHAPAGPRPRAPHGVGSAGSPRGACLDRDDRATKTSPHPRRPDFWNSKIRVDRTPRSLSPCSPRRGECWGARGGGSLVQFDPVPKTGPTLVDPFCATGRCGSAGTRRLSPRAPRRGECRGARGGKVWAGAAKLPTRVPSSQPRFFQLGDADRRAPADPFPVLLTTWGVRGGPRGAGLGQDGQDPKTGPTLTDPIFATQRSGGAHAPAGPRPRAPHGVGSVGATAGGPVWAGMTDLPKRATPSSTRCLELAGPLSACLPEDGGGRSHSLH